MWMLADQIKGCRFESHINEGRELLSGCRLYTGDGYNYQDHIATIGSAEDIMPDAGYAGMVIIKNREDYIAIEGLGVQEVANKVFCILEYYDRWYEQIMAAAERNDFQSFVDKCDMVFDNPVLLCDVTGRIIGISRKYGMDDIDELWHKIHTEMEVPNAALSEPFATMDGGNASTWTTVPTEYIMNTGMKIVGTRIRLKDEAIGGFSVWEFNRPITKAALQLSAKVCRVLGEAIPAFSDMYPHYRIRPHSLALHNLLEARDVPDNELKAIEENCPKPWQLMVIDNYYRKEVLHQNSLLSVLRKSHVPCVAVMFNDKVVVLVSSGNVYACVDIITGKMDKSFYSVGVSMPFSTLNALPVRYSQAEYALIKGGKKLGVFLCQDYAFELLISSIGDQSQARELVHPALFMLSEYDRKNNSELYETLYQFLMFERNWVKCAAELHIHRNTLVYRLNKIADITGVDLDEPMVRMYVLLSYMLEK